MGHSVCGRAWITCVDDYNKLAPIGAVGELLIEGPNLARHYYNNPTKTQAAFVDTPKFLQVEGTPAPQRVYRTGDLVQYSTDGTINYIGRRDSQVKIGGHRVDFGEIEHRIKALVPGTTEVACDAMVAGGREKALVVFLSMRHDPDDNTPEWKLRFENITAQLERRLAVSLPTYMVPHRYFHMQQMPLTSSGKMDRQRLVKIASDLSNSTSDTGQSAELTGNEKRIQSLWASVFQIPPSDIHNGASFLHYGDSIAAMKLVSTARREGLALTVRDILRYPILSDMAAHAIQPPKQSENEEAIPPYSLLSRAGGTTEILDETAKQCNSATHFIEDIYPCSPLQEELMAASLKQPGSYIAQSILTLTGGIEKEKLKTAWNTVFQHNSILRSRITQTDSGMVQAVFKEDIDWIAGDELESYLKTDQLKSMGLGDKLHRFALISSAGTTTLVFTHHHAMYDGFSAPAIFEQVESVYEGSTLSPIPEFKTFIKHLAETDKQSSAEFWRSELKGASSTNFPPIAATLSDLATSRKSQHLFSFTKPSMAYITASTVFRAAWAILIGTYCGTKEVVLGTTVSGRSAPVENIDMIVGPTISTIPVRVSIDQSKSVEIFLKQVQDQATAMMPHEQFGLHNIRRLGSELEAACDFKSLLVIQAEKPTVDSRIFTSGAELEALDETRTYALTLQVWPNSTGAKLIASYDARVLDEPQVQRMLHQYEHIVRELFAPEKKFSIRDFAVLPNLDRDEIIQWNSEEPQYFNGCVHRVIEQNALNTPKAPAISAWDGELDYSRLDKLSSTLAHHLISLGVGPEIKVPLCFEKSRWAVVALLAILKAGGAYVLLNPDHPTERLKVITQEVGATIILSSASNAKKCAKLAASALIVNQFAIDNLPAKVNSPQVSVFSSNAVYVQFTSGTTGKPKGAVIEHGSYCSAFLGHCKVTRIEPSSRVLQFASYGFDVANQDILTTLMAGACLCIPSDSERHDDIVSAMKKYQVDNANITPSFAKLISPCDVPNLRVLQLSGEPMTADAIVSWGSRLRLINGYGPSECCCVCSVNPSPSTDVQDARNIGHAAGCRLWIVDADNYERLLPIGAVGELIIEGPIVGRGYLNDPNKTQAAFVDKPSWLKRQSTLDGPIYRTGDLARYSSDGSITYIGRKDNQVKLRGQRIELEEVEFNLIPNIPSAAEVIVEIIRPADTNDQMLAAFIRLSNERQSADGIISEASDHFMKAMDGIDTKLSQVLPAYMIPTAFLPVNHIPLTASHKVNRNKIKEAASKLTVNQIMDFSTSESPGRQTLTDSERRLREAWSIVLGINSDTIQANNSFMRLGGDSIDAIRLVATLRTESLALSVADIFKYPRLSDMSLKVGETDAGKVTGGKPFELLRDSYQVESLIHAASAQCHVNQAEIEDIYPCTPLQQGMVALSMIQPGKVVSFKCFTLPFDVDVARFKASWETVVRNNAILRTRVVQIESELLQVVTRTTAVNWQMVDDLAAYRLSEGQRIMKLGDELIHSAIVKSQKSANYQFCLTLHHCVYDGWSLGLIFDQIEKVYRAEEIPPSPRFSSFISHISTDERNQQSKDFWQSLLTDCTPDLFPPPTSAGNAVRPGTTVASHFQLPQNIQAEVTIPIILHGAWAMIVAEYTGNDDVVYGTTVTGRNALVADVDKVVGPTFASVPWRVRLDYRQSVGQFLHALQQQSLDIIPYEQMGLQHIRRINSEAEAACNFQNILLIQPAIHEKSDGLLGSSQSLDDMADFNTHGLMVECQLDGSQVTLKANFDKSLISEMQMGRILAQFGHLAQQLCLADSSQPLELVEVISEDEKAELTVWEPMNPEPVQSCVHDTISFWAKSQPELQAIASWDGNMTHGELDNLTTEVASYLVHLGVGPETLVPLCFKKSLWAIVSVLAVMKAGGAFVPLDASHPVSRLETIVKETGAGIILCSQENSVFFSNLAASTLVIDSSIMERSKEFSGIDLPIVSPQNAAYCLFTSGTTGKPKGVVIEHAAFSTTAKAEVEMFGVTSSSRVLQFASYSFDTSLFEILSTLVAGGCICVPTEDERREPKDLAAAISRMNVNMTGLTPSFADVITPTSIPTVKTIILGGEALKQTHVDTWADHFTLMSAYGPTECSVTCSINNDMNIGTDPRNIGRPAGATRWIVDPRNSNRLRPIGAVGELIIEGPLLARGYLNNAEKEREAFSEGISFFGEGQRRRYKTGDLVRYNHDGTMTYVSRKDNQVKLRGQRLEVEEVEHHISKHDSINHCLVLVPKSGAWERQLVAVVTLDHPLSNREEPEGTGMQLTKASPNFVRERIASLADYLSANLPAHMVPSMWVVTESIPFTKAMKLDRPTVEKYVTSMDAATQQKARELIESSDVSHDWSELELVLRACWSEILHIPINAIAINSNFFKLGGDSIAAMRLVDVARSNGLNLTVSGIFNNAQLSSMSLISQTDSEAPALTEIPPFSMLGTIDQKEVLAEASQACCVNQNMIDDIYPCTSLQEGFMILSDQSPGSYIMQHVEEIPAHCDIDRFRAAWKQVIDCDHILRTRIFQSVQGVSFQVVINGQPSWAHSNNLDEYLEQDLATPMTFGEPLTRFAIVDDISSSSSYFVMTAHHSSFDGESLPQILERVSSAFQDREFKGPTPFKDFISYLSRLPAKASEQYWLSKFDGYASSSWPSLPSPSYRPLEDTVLCRDITFRRFLGSTFTASTIVRAAWSILLSKYTANDDVVFGVTVSGRNAPVLGIGNMSGPTISTVPVRVQLGETVDDLLKNIQDEAVAMMPYEQIGLQRIRRLSSNSMAACDFQTLLVVQPRHTELGSPLFGLPTSPASNRSQGSLTYAFTMFCELGDTTSRLKAGFDSRCVSHQQAERILHQMDHIIQQLCRDNSISSLSVKDIESISPFDITQLAHWNRLTPPLAETLLLDRIGAIVQANPQRTAVDAWDGSFNYEELDKFSSLLASTLICDGVGVGSVVPLCFEKSKWNVVAMLAVMKSGAAFCPLDPTLPKERLDSLTGIVGAKYMLCSSENLRLCQNLVDNVKEICYDTISTIQVAEHGIFPDIQHCTELYVMFTSGSTGLPKAVVLQHGATATSAEAHGLTLGLSQFSRVLQFAGHTWDISILEFLTTLSFGGCVCIPSDFDRMNYLTRYINTARVNMLVVTPSLAQTINPDEVPGIKVLSLIGESWGHGINDAWGGKVKLFNSYGPTEACIMCTAIEVDSTLYCKNNIGYGIGATTWITDPNNHNILTPIGCVGELLLEGNLLAKGYMHDDIKTAQAFVDNPTWATRTIVGGRRPPQRLYKTGDLVQYEDDGTITFRGRKDSQVKIRGKRVELEEIEHHLAAERQVRLAMVVYPSTGLLKNQLVGIISLSRSVSTSDLNGIEDIEDSKSLKPLIDKAIPEICECVRTQLSLKVAEYMVPAVWLTVESLPLLPSSKIDRKFLSSWVDSITPETLDLFSAIPPAEANRIYPAVTVAERIIQQVWGEVLDIPVENISTRTSFTVLGGDSVLAMLVVSRCRAQNVTISVRDILQQRTIAELASAAQSTNFQREMAVIPQDQTNYLSLLNSREVLSKIAPDLDISDPGLVEDVYLCLPVQQEMLSYQRENEEFYRVEGILRLGSPVGHVDVDILQQAWKQLVKRHGTLRSRFTDELTSNGAMYQIVFKTPIFQFIKLTSDTSEEALLKLNNLSQSSETSPFCVAVCVTSDGTTFCKIEAHHAIIDHASIGILLEELQLAYIDALPSTGKAGPLYRSFVDYSISQQSELSDAYWKRYIAGCHSLPFPVLADSPSRLLKSTPVSIKDIGALRTFCQVNHLTFFNLIQAAWALLLLKYTKSEEVGFCYLLSNRDAMVEGASEMVGLLVNIIPSRHTFSPTTTIMDLMRSAKDGFSDALKHPYSGFDRRTVMTEKGSRAPFDTLINYRGRISAAETNKEAPLTFDMVDGKDPMHVSRAIFLLLSQIY